MFSNNSEVMTTIEKEKNFLWNDVNELKAKLELQSTLYADLEVKYAEQQKEIERLNKSTPEHYQTIKNASREISKYKNRVVANIQVINETLETTDGALSRLTDMENEASSTMSAINIKNEEMLSAYQSIELESESIRSKIADTEGAVETLDDIVQTKASLEDSVQKIIDSSDQAIEIQSKVVSLHRAVIQERNEIRHAYDEIYGYESEDESEDEEPIFVKGKLAALDDVYSKNDTLIKQLHKDTNAQNKHLQGELESLEANTNERYNAYIEACTASRVAAKKSIDDLLPAAMTAGLAAAYDDKVETESEAIKMHEFRFFISIVALVLVSCLPLLLALNHLPLDKNSIKSLLNDIKSIVPFLLPLYTPILWWGYSANKKYKLSKRLIEEYTHKGVLSKTFEGLATQIQELPDSDIAKELRAKLLYNLVDVNSENPGKLISDYNKSDHPLMDVLDKGTKLADALSKLSRVPGVPALAKRFDERKQIELKDAGEKLNSVLDEDKLKKEA